MLRDRRTMLTGIISNSQEYVRKGIDERKNDDNTDKKLEKTNVYLHLVSIKFL